MPLPSIITIDGPAASGKSTIGKKLADELGYLFFDTGLMYRAVTWLALQHGVPIPDEAAVTALAENIEIDIRPPSQEDGRNCDILAGDQDMTWDIRRPEVEAHVSQVSAYPGVRRALSAQQRRIGRRGRVVMVGRDIGTVVLPEADLKVFLTASVETRAQRRFEETQARGETRDYESILANLRERDLIDSSRPVAPLRAAEDAIQLDTTGLDLPAVVMAIESLVADRS